MLCNDQPLWLAAWLFMPPAADTCTFHQVIDPFGLGQFGFLCFGVQEYWLPRTVLVQLQYQEHGASVHSAVKVLACDQRVNAHAHVKQINSVK